MNIYIYLEISKRELDSKLLLAVLAASKGHDVLISNWANFALGFESKSLSPGIFYTKSITPSPMKLEKNDLLLRHGVKITCIDEESGLTHDNFDDFVSMRFSQETIDQVSAIFCWGNRDYHFLKNIFPTKSDVFHLTGSPRVDLWGAYFLPYWDKPITLPKRPFVLVSSNLGLTNGRRSFFDFYKSILASGYFARLPNFFDEIFGKASEEFLLTREYIRAIKTLCDRNPHFDVVFRPHPNENEDIWKTYLQNIPNCKVISSHSIGSWIGHASALVHNGCLTALEATVANLPVITFAPFNQVWENDLPNQLGVKVANGEELSDAVNAILRDRNHFSEKRNSDRSFLKNLVFFDDSILSARKIMDVWSELDDGSLSQPSHWRKFKNQLSLIRFKNFIKLLLRRFFGINYSVLGVNHKFPPFDLADIEGRVKRLESVLGLNGELRCTLLADRALLITKR